MRYLILTAIGAAAIVAFSCSNERDGFLSNLLRGTPAGVPVTVETIASITKTETISIPASLSASERVDVSLPDDALIESFAVSEGEPIAAGDVIARISEEEINVRIARLRADLREIRNRLEKESYILRNRDRLLDEGRIDEEQYEAVEESVAKEEAESERIMEEISRMESGLGELSVTSPISGILTRRHAAAGSMAAAGIPVATVARIDPSVLTFRVGSELSPAIRPDMRLEVIFPSLGDSRSTARVTSVGTKLDPESRTFEVKAELPNPNGIYKEGMSALVEARSPEQRRIFLVPESALIREPTGFFVFTVIDGKAHKVQVIPEESSGGYIEIARGLKEADMVIVRGQDRIEQGTSVDIWGR